MPVATISSRFFLCASLYTSLTLLPAVMHNAIAFAIALWILDDHSQFGMVAIMTVKVIVLAEIGYAATALIRRAHRRPKVRLSLVVELFSQSSASW